MSIMVRNWLLFVSLMLGILGCSKVEQPRTLHFSTNKGIPIINVQINGKGGKLLVDTGATKSIIDSNLSYYYDFDMQDGTDEVTGIGGVVLTGLVTGAQTTYNDSILSIRFHHMDFKAVRKSTSVVGVLGSDYLMANNLVVDFSNNTIYPTE